MNNQDLSWWWCRPIAELEIYAIVGKTNIPNNKDLLKNITILYFISF